jgi:hypothetical protein
VIEKLPFKIESGDQVKDLPTIGKSLKDHVCMFNSVISYCQYCFLKVIFADVPSINQCGSKYIFRSVM